MGYHITGKVAWYTGDFNELIRRYSDEWQTLNSILGGDSATLGYRQDVDKRGMFERTPEGAYLFMASHKADAHPSEAHNTILTVFGPERAGCRTRMRGLEKKLKIPTLPMPEDLRQTFVVLAHVFESVRYSQN